MPYTLCMFIFIQYRQTDDDIPDNKGNEEFQMGKKTYSLSSTIVGVSVIFETPALRRLAHMLAELRV